MAKPTPDTAEAVTFRGGRRRLRVSFPIPGRSAPPVAWERIVPVGVPELMRGAPGASLLPRHCRADFVQAFGENGGT
jgi:hypothetical protein